jgi:hypothetical protein
LERGVFEMTLVGWARRELARNRRSRTGISTIMANLTMLLIVMTLSSILFVWATTSFSTYAGGAGFWFSSKSLANQERLSVENVFFSKTGSVNNGVTLYVRNVGSVPFTIASVYVNNTLYNISLPPAGVNAVLSIPITLSGQSWGKGDLQTILIATLRGTSVTTTWVP